MTGEGDGGASKYFYTSTMICFPKHNNIIPSVSADQIPNSATACIDLLFLKNVCTQDGVYK